MNFQQINKSNKKSRSDARLCRARPLFLQILFHYQYSIYIHLKAAACTNGTAELPRQKRELHPDFKAVCPYLGM